MLYFANSQRGALKRYVSIPRESSLFSLRWISCLLWCNTMWKRLRKPHPHPGNLKISLLEYLSKTSHSQLRGERETAQEGRSTGHD